MSGDQFYNNSYQRSLSTGHKEIRGRKEQQQTANGCPLQTLRPWITSLDEFKFGVARGNSWTNKHNLITWTFRDKCSSWMPTMWVHPLHWYMTLLEYRCLIWPKTNVYGKCSPTISVPFTTVRTTSSLHMFTDLWFFLCRSLMLIAFHRFHVIISLLSPRIHFYGAIHYQWNRFLIGNQYCPQIC